MKFGIDIENEFKDEVNTINKNEQKRNIVYFSTLIILLGIYSIWVINKYYIYQYILGGLLFLNLFLLATKYKIKTETKISDLISYYLYLTSIQVEKLDKQKPTTFEKTNKTMKNGYNHINSYLEDYQSPYTYYIDFDSHENIEIQLIKIQTLFKKIYSKTNNNNIPKVEIKEKLIDLAQELYGTSRFTKKFNITLNDTLKILEKEKETELNISPIDTFITIIKNTPKIISYGVLFLIGSYLIHTTLPISEENKWMGTLMIFVGFLTIYKK